MSSETDTFGDPMPTADVGGLLAAFLLSQDPDDLLLRDP
jgi:hypothetical protein